MLSPRKRLWTVEAEVPEVDEDILKDTEVSGLLGPSCAGDRGSLPWEWRFC